MGEKADKLTKEKLKELELAQLKKALEEAKKSFKKMKSEFDEINKENAEALKEYNRKLLAFKGAVEEERFNLVYNETGNNLKKEVKDRLIGNFDTLIRAVTTLERKSKTAEKDAPALHEKMEAKRKAEQEKQKQAEQIKRAEEEERKQREAEQRAREKAEADRKAKEKAAQLTAEKNRAQEVQIEQAKQAKIASFAKITGEIIRSINQYAATKHKGGLFIFKHFRDSSRTKQQNLLIEGLKAITSAPIELDEKVKIAKGLLLFVQGEIAAERVILNESRLKAQIMDAIIKIDGPFKPVAAGVEPPTNEACIEAFKEYAKSKVNLNIFKGIPAKIDASQKKIGKKVGKKQ